MEDKLIDFILGLPSRPWWVTKNTIETKVDDEGLDIIMQDKYHIKIYFDSAVFDCAFSDGAYCLADLQYAVKILTNRKKILGIYNDT